MKAKHLTEGDIVALNGKPWTVLSNRKVADGWHLTVANASGLPYSKVVPGKREFEVVDRAPIHDETGAQTRWAGVEDVVEVLGGIELYRVTDTSAGKQYVCAPVDESTVAAHLLAFHNLTWAGVSLGAARAAIPNAERTLTPEEALKQADFEGMLAMHETLHQTGELPVQHTHGPLS